MRRVPNWDVKATNWATAQLGKPFVWGETDCCSLLRQMWEEMYGEPLMPLLYQSLAAALVFSESVGGVRQVLHNLGCTPLDVIPRANTGDVLIAAPRDDEPFDAVMPVITDQFLFTEPTGLVQLLPLDAAPLDALPYRLAYEW